MAAGSLRLAIMDFLATPIDGQLKITFEPAASSPGGTVMEVNFPTAEETDFIVEKLQCRGGPGTLYRVAISTKNFRIYSFFQLILAERINSPSESPVRLMAKPKRVKDIAAPVFSALDPSLRAFLNAARIQAPEKEDRDLMGLRGKALYDSLGPLRKASLLNLFTKARHTSSDSCFGFLDTLAVLRQDRCFCSVNSNMQESLRLSGKFRSAPNKLHEPLANHQLEESFKTRDDHANLQVTFMRHKQTGVLSADVDIDESNGIEHGFEVIRNAITDGRTNPYVIRELMLQSQPVEKVLDPGYRFVFS